MLGPPTLPLPAKSNCVWPTLQVVTSAVHNKETSRVYTIDTLMLLTIYRGRISLYYDINLTFFANFILPEILPDEASPGETGSGFVVKFLLFFLVILLFIFAASSVNKDEYKSIEK